jgi:hypothetical protein
MTRKPIGAILAVVILAVAAPLVVLALLHALEGETQAAPAADGQPTLKWEQLPDLTPTGLDVYASFQPFPVPPPHVLADDFPCTETGPITQIEFWGSWYHNVLPQSPLSFTLSIHSDIPDPDPGNPDDFSQPGGVLWWDTFEVGPGGCVANLEQEGVPEGFYIPGLEFYEFPADSQVWRYTCPIPSGQQFIQQQGTIYWLDVQAVYQDPTPQVWFGWKTSLHHWQDDAVWALGTEPGPPPLAWSDLKYPAGHPFYPQSIDLAFGISGPPTTPEFALKWEQLPDLTETGMDVYADTNLQHPPHVLADDFRCTQTGPITQIEFWGSWWYDQPPPPPGASFTLSIHSNVPGPPFSQPGGVLWSDTYQAGECEAIQEQAGPTEGFYLPYTEYYDPQGDHVVWRYTCPGPDPAEFIQQEGTIYWLDVQDLVQDGTSWFGWKTSLQHWQDDAVWALGIEPGEPVWSELRYPEPHPLYPQSIDLAFRIWGIKQADLEKVDLQIRPFYCGDSDMDGLEAGGWAQAGLGDCCDGVDNDGNGDIDGQDPDCQLKINEDPENGMDDDLPPDGLIDEDPPSYDAGLPITWPWNGDDDGDTFVDEDPKNNKDDDADGNENGTRQSPPGTGTCADGIENDDPPDGIDCADPDCAAFCDEDPANGFLAINNDRDRLVDEDGGGRFDFNGNTVIDPCVDYPGYGLLCENQIEGVDDDGDTSVDEDPLDSPVAPDLPPVTKWVQPPDPSPSGWDIMATWLIDLQPPPGSGSALADDYPCTKTGSVTEIRFWGSWRNDVLPAGGPANVYFSLSIHSDVPAGYDRPYSHPGPMMWMRPYGPGQCQIIAQMPAPETFVDPLGIYGGIDNMAYLYSCPLNPGEFVQQGTPQEPIIYWLDVQAHLSLNPDGAIFGWKTSPVHFNDFAVYAPAREPIDPLAWEPTPGKDLAFEIVTQQVVPTHEPHYLVKEILVNHGPEASVVATDTKEIDAPYWRVNALEDGLTTCNDNLDNDPWNSDGKDAADPDCLNPHIGEEAPGLHSCNDTLDNGAGIGQGDGLIDEQDPQCQTRTEVSVECENLDTDRVSIKEGVPLYVKPPSDSELLRNRPGCAQYYTTDPNRWSKCVPCKIPIGVAPPGGIDKTCGEILTQVVPPAQQGPGYCIAVDSMPGVTKELDLQQNVELGYRTHNMYLQYGSADPPIGSMWGEAHPEQGLNWEVTSWEDNGDEILSASDQIDMVEYYSREKAWFHVDEVTHLVFLYGQSGLVAAAAPIWPASIYQPIGAWTVKVPPLYFGDVCEVSEWTDSNENDKVDQGDQLRVNNCAGIGQPLWLTVGVVYLDIWLSQKVVDEHQFDLACEGETSLHRFTIQNELAPPEGVTDPNWDNNAKETTMLVGCTSFAQASVHDLNVPLPDPLPFPPHWDVDVGYPESIPVSVFATNSGPAPADFVVSLEEESPGLWYTGIPLEEDPDGDGWATKVENILGSRPDVNASRPENLHAAGTCNDGVDNDADTKVDAADSMCVDSDGEGYSDLYEFMSGSNPADPTSSPEHMQFPWTCGDGIDNDGDGFCDGGGCGLLPAEGSTILTGESLYDGDNFADCSTLQLGGISPPVYCASGWAREDLNGDTRPDGTDADEYVHLAGDGTLTVGLNIPLNSLLGTTPVSRKLVLTCFLSKNPYPTETVRARIRAADVHVLDGNPYNNDVFSTFDGTASCKDGEVTLDIVSWVFDPASAPADFHVNEEQVFQTTKTIRNSGPADPVDVRVRKYLNVPVSCDGSLEISDDLETVFIAEGLQYNVDNGHAGPWNTAPAGGIELTPAEGQTVYVQGEPPPFSQEVAELFAYFTLADVPMSPPDVTVVENFDIYCREAGSKPFLFSNQITTGPDWPDICMTADSHIREDHAMSVNVQPDADADTWPDAVDNCPDVPNPDQTNTDLNYPSPGNGPKGDACDYDDDNDGWEDTSEVPGGGGGGLGDAIGSNPLVPGSKPEVCDGVDNDGNESVDEGFPDTTPGLPKDCMDNNYDADGDKPAGGDPQRGGNAEDTNDDSWFTGGTWHHDMFPDSHENFAGTRRDVACWTAGNPVDADPFDPFPSGTANVFDIMKFYEAPQAYGAKLYPDHDGYKRRLDLFGPDMQINVFDIMQYYTLPAAFGNACPYGK